MKRLTPYRRALSAGFIILVILGVLLLQPLGFKHGALNFSLHSSGYFSEVTSVGAVILSAGLICGALWVMVPTDNTEKQD